MSLFPVDIFCQACFQWRTHGKELPFIIYWLSSTYRPNWKNTSKESQDRPKMCLGDSPSSQTCLFSSSASAFQLLKWLTSVTDHEFTLQQMRSGSHADGVCWYFRCWVGVFGLNWSPVTAPEKCESAVGPFCQPGQDVTDTLAHPK